MRNKIFATLFLTTVFVLLLGGCASSNIIPALKGGYQSEIVDGEFVQMSFQPDNNSFIEYISNREVDKGTFEELKNGLYKITGDMQEFEITLNSDNSFDLIVKGLNQGKPIRMKNIDDIPVYFSTKFNDVDEYKSLLED
ncbi:hypothetical protein GCM10011351_25710 [Paraliobacillus quinghaiensis]|uniref:Uncharacterized protein n=1 Tax=Paraliobacillus quinghaiensis TaxID=470815 RepID=A0A917WXG5_9BACI|nr:hypothetical protein [Paraliobacillus quinghaiensis]GGM38464.1 hypothetical protein GCM10011351_25710 [Paraliobacillus quinghaiensis]